MSDDANRQFVAYRVGDQILLTAVNQIKEIIEPVSVTPIPGAHAWFIGLTGCRGNILAVTDLGAFLYGAGSRTGPNGRIIVVCTEEEDFALLVDDIVGLKKFSGEQARMDAGDISRPLRPYVRESIHDQDDFLPILDAIVLVTSDRFLSIKQLSATEVSSTREASPENKVADSG